MGLDEFSLKDLKIAVIRTTGPDCMILVMRLIECFIVKL